MLTPLRHVLADPFWDNFFKDVPINARPGAYALCRLPRINVRPRERAFVLARDSGRCVWCGTTDALCVDHIVPIARGGAHHPDNWQCLCATCNHEKGSELCGYPLAAAPERAA